MIDTDCNYYRHKNFDSSIASRTNQLANNTVTLIFTRRDSSAMWQRQNASTDSLGFVTLVTTGGASIVIVAWYHAHTIISLVSSHFYTHEKRSLY